MASGITKIVDVVVPEVFSPYTQQLTHPSLACTQRNPRP